MKSSRSFRSCLPVRPSCCASGRGPPISWSPGRGRGPRLPGAPRTDLSKWDEFGACRSRSTPTRLHPGSPQLPRFPAFREGKLTPRRLTSSDVPKRYVVAVGSFRGRMREERGSWHSERSGRKLTARHIVHNGRISATRQSMGDRAARVARKVDHVVTRHCRRLPNFPGNFPADAHNFPASSPTAGFASPAR